MILNAVLCYLISALIIFAGVTLVYLYFKKTGKTLSLLHSFFGALGFVVMLIAMFVLMLYAFSQSSTAYMTALMPEGIYKITVAVLFFTAVGLVRYFALNSAYFNKFKEDKGVSFLVGYGMAGGVAVALYCIVTLIHLVVCALSSEFTGIDKSVFLFENGARVSTFEPFYSHIFVALVFVVYTALMIILSVFMQQHATRPYKSGKTLRMYLLINGCEILMICVILFTSAKISTIVIAAVCLVVAVLAALAVRLLYKYEEENPYNKQFE